jgi:alpha-L-rhamnosidase
VSDPARIKFTAAPPIAPTGEPFDPETDVVLANTFYSHFVYRALAKAGRFDAVLRLVRERYGDMLARGATTLWESFAPTASLCHGFSATPVFQLSTEVLGVEPLAPGCARFRFSPQPADLGFARGVFPTVAGDVRVDWARRGDALEIALEVPPGTSAELVDPPGFTFGAQARVRGPGKHRLELRAS